jgi:hypothetical protein
VTKWYDRNLATRLSVGLGVAALMYVGRVCALFGAGLLLYAVFEGAWGPAGVLGMANLAGSFTCGVVSSVSFRRDAGQVGRLVLVNIGAIVLLFLGAMLVATQLL